MTSRPAATSTSGTSAATNGAGDSLLISTTATSPTSPAGAPYGKDFRLVDRDVILAPKWGSPGVTLMCE